MPLHLGRRTRDPQIFSIQRKTVPVVESNVKHLLVLGKPQFRRPRRTEIAAIGCSHFRSPKALSGALFLTIYSLSEGGRRAPVRARIHALPGRDMNIAVPPPTFERPAGQPAPLIDPFARPITYLRVSVTDRCDFRCVYCMSEHMSFLPKADLLTLEELDRLCSAFIDRGVRKLRLTGGEPLVRRGIMTLVSSLSRHLRSGALDELTLTTNGSQLAKYAGELRDCGVKRVNVSLDTLDPDKFRAITRWGELDKVLQGIDAAQAAGLHVKINAVALKGVNEDE